MIYGEGERGHHTRVGWWLMTHDRGGATLLATAALFVLTADLFYAAARWGRLTGPFDRSFIAGVATSSITLLLAKPLGVGQPSGRDREDAKARAQRINVALTALIVASTALFSWLGSTTAAILGALSVLTVGFGLVCIRAVVRPQSG